MVVVVIGEAAECLFFSLTRCTDEDEGKSAPVMQALCFSHNYTQSTQVCD